MSASGVAGAAAAGGRLHVELRAHPRDDRFGPLLAELATLAAAEFPAGLAVAVVDREGSVLTAHGGWCNLHESRVPVARDTLFDLASVTKIVVATTLAVLFEQRGIWSLEDRVDRWVPDFPAPTTRLVDLITHTSGLIPHRPYFETLLGRRQIRAAVCRDGMGTSPVSEVSYSDLNFMLLGWALERAGGQRIDRLFADAVAGPLGMTATRYRPPARVRDRTAATELNGDQRRTPTLVWGDVHDGNTWAVGGISGHAGLFAPVDDMARFVAALLDPDRHPVLSRASIEAMTRRHAGQRDEVRGLGWRLEPDADWGSWSRRSFWHTGFTGTSILADPERGVGVVVLTNALHPDRLLDARDGLVAKINRLAADAWS